MLSPAMQKTDELEQIQAAFKIFDKDGSGTLQNSEAAYVKVMQFTFRYLANQCVLGEQLTDNEVD